MHYFVLDWAFLQDLSTRNLIEALQDSVAFGLYTKTQTAMGEWTMMSQDPPEGQKNLLDFLPGSKERKKKTGAFFFFYQPPYLSLCNREPAGYERHLELISSVC